MAVLGRPFLMASSTLFHWASRGPALAVKANMFTRNKAATRNVRFIQVQRSDTVSFPLDGDPWFVLRERLLQADIAPSRAWAEFVSRPRAREYSDGMKQFTAIVHRGEPEEGGFWATCLEVPGANGQGETKEECLRNLSEAIKLIVETEREEAFRIDPNAEATELRLA